MVSLARPDRLSRFRPCRSDYRGRGLHVRENVRPILNPSEREGAKKGDQQQHVAAFARPPRSVAAWMPVMPPPRPSVFFFSAASCDRRLSSLSYRRFLCTNGSIGATAAAAATFVCRDIRRTIAASLSAAMLLPLGHPQRVENRLRHGALQPPLKEGM